MKKTVKVISVVLTICLALSCLCSCSPDEFQRAGKISLLFSSNIIGAEKGFEVETEKMNQAAQELISSIAPSSGSGGGIPTSPSDIAAMVESINSFSGRLEPLKTTTSDAGFTYEKTVDLTKDKVEDDDNKTVANSIITALSGNPQSTGLLAAAVHQDLDMSKYSVQYTAEAAKLLIDSFWKSTTEGTEKRKIANLAKECINGCMNAVQTSLEHAKENTPTNNTLTLEDVVIASIANVVKTEYGKYAIDSSYDISEILPDIPGALDYFNALMNMGIIPRFNVAKLVSDFQNNLID